MRGTVTTPAKNRRKVETLSDRVRKQIMAWMPSEEFSEEIFVLGIIFVLVITIVIKISIIVRIVHEILRSWIV